QSKLREKNEKFFFSQKEVEFASFHATLRYEGSRWQKKPLQLRSARPLAEWEKQRIITMRLVAGGHANKVYEVVNPRGVFMYDGANEMKYRKLGKKRRGELVIARRTRDNWLITQQGECIPLSSADSKKQYLRPFQIKEKDRKKFLKRTHYTHILYEELDCEGYGMIRAGLLLNDDLLCNAAVSEDMWIIHFHGYGEQKEFQKKKIDSFLDSSQFFVENGFENFTSSDYYRARGRVGTEYGSDYGISTTREAPYSVTEYALHGNLEGVKKEIMSGAPVESIGGKWRSTPLLQAASKDHLHVVKYLVEESKANLLAKDAAGMGVLSSSIRGMTLNVTKYLIEEANVDVNAQDQEGGTALSKAARYGYKKAVRYLVQYGKADIRLKELNSTPLEIAEGTKRLREGDLETFRRIYNFFFLFRGGGVIDFLAEGHEKVANFLAHYQETGGFLKGV
ncbi:hypothetical protein AAMO2058_000115900, partial [Amorphochlora amoebiformis]